MVRFVSQGGLICPMLVCDWCEKVIDEPGRALIGCIDLDESRAVVLHKGHCDQAYENTFGRVTIWDEVEKVISDLSHNTLRLNKTSSAKKQRCRERVN